MSENLRPRGAKFADLFARRAWKWFKTTLTIFCIIVFFFGILGGGIWCHSTGCEGDHKNAKRVVESAGFTEVEIGGPQAYNCGRDDTVSNTFTAIAANKRYVEGTVCCRTMGCGQGCSLRFE